MTIRVSLDAPLLPFVRERTLLGSGALLLGLALLYVVGFAPLPAVHNAAHDTRHTAAFPCH